MFRGRVTALRDGGVIRCICAKTVRGCSIRDVLGGKPPVTVQHRKRGIAL